MNDRRRGAKNSFLSYLRFSIYVYERTKPNARRRTGGKERQVSKIEKRLKSSGLKMRYVAQQLGITEMGLYNKRSGRQKWRRREIKALAEILHVPEEDLLKEAGALIGGNS